MLDNILFLIFLICNFGIVGFAFYYFAKRIYERAKHEFEQENPHLKGRYFSFKEWWILGDDSGMSHKIKQERFGEGFVDTDGFSYKAKKIGAKIKFTRVLWLLLIIPLIIFGFYILDPKMFSEIIGEHFWSIKDITLDVRSRL